MDKPEFVPDEWPTSSLMSVTAIIDHVKAIEAHLAAQSQPAEDRQPIMLEIAEADENHKKWERRWKALMRMYPPESPCFADRNGEWCLRYFLDYVGAACGFVGQEHPIAQPADRQLDPQAAEPVGDEVELIARALCRNGADEIVQGGDVVGETIDMPAWMLYLPEARRVISALRKPAREVPDGDMRHMLAELHEVMADVMEQRRPSSTDWQRKKAENAIAVWRKVQAYLTTPATLSTPAREVPDSEVPSWRFDNGMLAGKIDGDELANHLRAHNMAIVYRKEPSDEA